MQEDCRKTVGPRPQWPADDGFLDYAGVAMYAALFCAVFACGVMVYRLAFVPGPDAVPLNPAGEWQSSVGGTDDFVVQVARQADGALVSRWFDGAGIVRHKGTLTLSEGVWVESYDPDYSRCTSWKWTERDGCLVDQNAPRGWTLRRPGKGAPDL